MKGELVSTITEDRVRLDGFFSQSINAKNTEIDSAIIVHGLSGNFYKSRLLKHFAETLQNEGIHSLIVNTRGHDYLNSTPRQGRAATLGTAVEIIDECQFDLYAWVEFLRKREDQKILLVGHSLGAIKSLLAQAYKPHPNVHGIAAFSATKLSYDSLLSSEGSEKFIHWVSTAKERVAQNRGNEFLFVDFPFPTWMSAKAYLAKYADADRNNWISHIDQISVPVLAVFGQREMEENAAFQAMKEDLQNINQPNFEIRYIDNADHFYSACYNAASSELIRWLRQYR